MGKKLARRRKSSLLEHKRYYKQLSVHFTVIIKGNDAEEIKMVEIYKTRRKMK
jgi:hypothetical protein